MEENKEFKFKITKHLVELGEQNNGWLKELNMVSWNDRPPVWDIRCWSPDHTKMAKGVTLTASEINKIKAVL